MSVNLVFNINLKIPCRSSFEIVLKVEHIFQLTVVNQCSPPISNNLIGYLSNKVINLLNVLKLFLTLQSYVTNYGNPGTMEQPHTCLVKILVSRHFKVRFLSYCSTATEQFWNEASHRNSRKKINRGEWFVGKNLKSMKKILINKKRIQRIHFYSL
jgi:hypothetical protein